MTSEPANTFRGLPLTAVQDSEIRHYIHTRVRSGLPWDTLELEAMLSDMLDPPEADQEDQRTLSDSMTLERAALVLDGGKDLDRADAHPESCMIASSPTGRLRALFLRRMLNCVERAPVTDTCRCRACTACASHRQDG